MRWFGYLGLALVAAGILVLLGVVPMAMLVVDTTPPSIDWYYPSGTYGAPTPLKIGDDLAVKAYVSDNMGLDRVYATVTVQCVVSALESIAGATAPVSTSKDMVFNAASGKYEAVFTWDELSGLCYGSGYAGIETSKHITVTVTAVDVAGNTASATAYVKPVANLGSPGTFYVCWGGSCTAVTSEDDRVYVNSSSLHFEFVPSSGWEGLIARVYVEIKRDPRASGTQYTLYAQADGTYRSSTVTLSDGVYYLEGYVVDTSSSRMRLMSLVLAVGGIGEKEAAWGELGKKPWTVTIFGVEVPVIRLVVGTTLVAVGAAIAAYGWREWM